MKQLSMSRRRTSCQAPDRRPDPRSSRRVVAVEVDLLVDLLVDLIAGLHHVTGTVAGSLRIKGQRLQRRCS